MQNFIGERAIYQEAQIIKADAQKAIFKIILQTCDEVNQNKRLYPRKVLTNAMVQAEERINNRKFMGELDHPLVSGNEAFDGMRQTTVLLKEVAHLVRTYEWQGNNLVGELETLRTPNGKIALGLLLDKVTLGVSMRGLAEILKENNVNIVQEPLYIIDYDLVSLPSHKGSVVNFNEMRFENKNLLTESCGTVCYNGICYLPDYFDKLVESKVIKFFDRWV
jgi:hypothetical protein